MSFIPFVAWKLMYTLPAKRSPLQMGKGPPEEETTTYIFLFQHVSWVFGVLVIHDFTMKQEQFWHTSRDLASWKLFGARHDAMDGRRVKVHRGLMTSSPCRCFHQSEVWNCHERIGGSVNKKNWGTLRMTTFTNGRNNNEASAPTSDMFC